MTGEKQPMPEQRPDPANDNTVAASPEIAAALKRIAQAIGRHMAHEAFRKARAANDNNAPASGDEADET